MDDSYRVCDMVVQYRDLLGIGVLGIEASFYEAPSIKCVSDTRYGKLKREIPSTQYLCTHASSMVHLKIWYPVLGMGEAFCFQFSTILYNLSHSKSRAFVIQRYKGIRDGIIRRRKGFSEIEGVWSWTVLP